MPLHLNLSYQEAAAVKSAWTSLDETGADFLIEFGPVHVRVLTSGLVEVRGGPHGDEAHLDFEAFKAAYGLEDFQSGLLAFAREVEAMCEWRLEDAIRLEDSAERRFWERCLARSRAAIAAPWSEATLMRRIAGADSRKDGFPDLPGGVSVCPRRPLNLTLQMAVAVVSALITVDFSGGKIQIEFGPMDVYITESGWLTVRDGPHGYEEHKGLEEFKAAYALEPLFAL